MTLSADDLLGKRVLVGLTCVDSDDHVLAQFQSHGLVTEVREDTIVLTRDDGSSFGLPPAPELFEVADPGIYTLRETGESIENPDFLTSLTIAVKDRASLGEVRAHGFSPPDPGQAS